MISLAAPLASAITYTVSALPDSLLCFLAVLPVSVVRSVSIEDLSTKDLSTEDLSTKDLSGKDLSTKDLSGKDLSAACTVAVKFPNMLILRVTDSSTPRTLGDFAAAIFHLFIICSPYLFPFPAASAAAPVHNSKDRLDSSNY
jgi:hypothetical protein